jgi:hypothetical protein
MTLKKATLYPADLTVAEGVTFDFNPKNIKISHSVSANQVGAKASGTTEAGTDPAKDGSQNLTREQEYEKSSMTMLKLADVVFDGYKVLRNCGLLLKWSYLYTVEATNTRQLLGLNFVWCNFQLGANTKIGSKIPVLLMRADVSYERFLSDGTPIRATVGLDLQINSADPMAQNPTSGGLTGRSGRTVIDGDSLPGIAVAEYGRPGEWRRLAEANDLDDPLRIRPGSTLYLPSRAEVAGRRPA